MLTSPQLIAILGAFLLAQVEELLPLNHVCWKNIQQSNISVFTVQQEMFSRPRGQRFQRASGTRSPSKLGRKLGRSGGKWAAAKIRSGTESCSNSLHLIILHHSDGVAAMKQSHTVLDLSLRAVSDLRRTLGVELRAWVHTKMGSSVTMCFLEGSSDISPGFRSALYTCEKCVG